MNLSKKLNLLAVTGLLSASLLTGCGAADSAEAGSAAAESLLDETTSSVEDASESDAESAEAEATAYPISVSTAFGDVVIESKPERIVTIGWGNQDVPLALGVVPVGVSRANYGLTEDSGLLYWTDEAFRALGEETPNVFDDTDGLDFEAISNAEPDVILAAYSGLTEEEYNQLSEIAPVIAYPEAAWVTTWRDMTLTDAKGIGMETEGAALVAETDAFIDEQLATHPAVEGKRGAFVYFNPADLSSFYVYTTLDPRAAYLTDLGLSLPEEILALDDGSSFAVSVSAENIDVLNNLDVIITYGDADTLSILQADALAGQVPAVASGAVVTMDNNSAIAASCTPSPLSIKATLEEYLDMIETALNAAE